MINVDEFVSASRRHTLINVKYECPIGFQRHMIHFFSKLLNLDLQTVGVDKNY